MNNVYQVRSLCSACKDFMDCYPTVQHDTKACEYFVKRYSRLNKPVVVGDIINKLRFDPTFHCGY